MDQRTSQFEVGDVVQLRSGGPRMTVEVVTKPNNAATGFNYKCMWFAGELDTMMRSGHFAERLLRGIEVKNADSGQDEDVARKVLVAMNALDTVKIRRSAFEDAAIHLRSIGSSSEADAVENEFLGIVHEAQQEGAAIGESETHGAMANGKSQGASAAAK